MNNLLAFLFRYRGILVFAILEVLSLYLLIRPLRAVVRGTGAAIKNIPAFRSVLLT